jgi:hypothetical protein
MLATAAAEHERRWPTRLVRLDYLSGRQLPAGRPHHSSVGPSEELS